MNVSSTDSAPTKIPITIWGAGSWGTALAILLDHKKHSICLWDRNAKKIEKIKKTKINEDFLGKTKIPESLILSSCEKQSCQHSNLHILAVPSKALRSLLNRIKTFVQKEDSFVSVIKGIEENSSQRMSQVIEEILNDHRPIACLTGPTHAEEVIQNQPCAAVVGSHDHSFSEHIQQHLSTKTLRIYINNDLVGIELGAALKNVIAIAAGISDGLGFASNSKSALITRGLSEIQKILIKEGAHEKTIMGLSGIGDLITTCMSQHSRNRYLGECLGKGLPLKEILKKMKMVAEGLHTAQSAQALSQKHNLSSPIITNVYQILFENKSPQKALLHLFDRPQKKEFF